MAYFFDGKKHHLIDGVFVEDDALKIAQQIHDYDPKLTLICLDPNDPDVKFTSAPFMVIQEMPDGTYEKVLEAWELDARVLQRVWAADFTKANQLEAMDAMEARFKKEQEDQRREAIGAKTEMAIAAFKNPTSSFSFVKEETGDLVTIHDRGPKTLNKAKKSVTMDIPNFRLGREDVSK